MDMPMHFFFSNRVTLLFDFWNVSSPAGMALSVLLIVLMAILYEIIKLIKMKTQHRISLAMANPVPSRELLLEPDRTSINSGTTECNPPNKWWVLLHGAVSLLHMVQVALGYALMLCVMTYNSWIFLGVIVGSTIGYYLLFPMQLQTFDSCHVGAPTVAKGHTNEGRVRTGGDL
ncbi:protein SLC31A2 [Ambystoma mexicanum]|uniref:protein SLC31A2 n=1 Tax=Ambystoma mexicanum TaxID=8296 RepID=UPI0037E6FCB5